MGNRAKMEEGNIVAAKQSPKGSKPKKKQPSKGEQHVAQRQRAQKWRQQAKAQSHSGPRGVTKSSIQRDGTLNATEKANMIAILNKARNKKARSKGEG